ncbi:UNVERIFIED_CONTAM: hypothetical protein K2H54_024868 [Gekko kuhli]
MVWREKCNNVAEAALAAAGIKAIKEGGKWSDLQSLHGALGLGPIAHCILQRNLNPFTSLGHSHNRRRATSEPSWLHQSQKVMENCLPIILAGRTKYRLLPGHCWNPKQPA